MRQPRNVETYLSDQNLCDAVSGLFYHLHIVHDGEIITKVYIGEPDARGLRNIKFTCIEEKEVELIVHS